MKELLKSTVKKLFYTAPRQLSKKQIHFNQEQIKELSASIEKNYLDRGNTKERLPQKEYDGALEGQLFERLYYNRNRIIPWLNKSKALKGAKILEIGCGTGISTLALTEQGATVTGVDVDGGALEVAKDRLRIAGYEHDFHLLNADEIAKFKDQHFDFILYYAVLEHMTIEERLVSLKQAWEMLPENGLLAVIETPNRLWYYDSHTAAMPFYDWLPEDLGFYYSKFSGRENFKDSYRELNKDKLLAFLRWGRGASYHEFEVAIKPLKELNVISSLMQFERNLLLKCGVKGLFYSKFIKSLNNDLSKGFCYPYLDIILKK